MKTKNVNNDLIAKELIVWENCLCPTTPFKYLSSAYAFVFWFIQFKLLQHLTFFFEHQLLQQMITQRFKYLYAKTQTKSSSWRLSNVQMHIKVWNLQKICYICLSLGYCIWNHHMMVFIDTFRRRFCDGEDSYYYSIHICVTYLLCIMTNYIIIFINFYWSVTNQPENSIVKIQIHTKMLVA